MQYRSLFIASMLMISGYAGFAQPPKAADQLKEFNYKANLVYKIAGADTLDMLLFLPKVEREKKKPVMLFIHGGGWGGGDKFKILGAPFWGTLRSLLDHGIACATIEYRLTRTGISTVYECVVDCKDAARFLMKNAMKLGLDASRIGVWGDSAGGHLCLMTALADDKSFPGDASLEKFTPRFTCVASYYPLTSFTKTEYLVGSNFEKPERFIPLLGGRLSDKQELARMLSPVEWIGKNSPPVLLLHGELDKVLPIQQSIYLQEVGLAKGADVQLFRVKNADHSFNGGHPEPSMDEINRFAADYMIGKLLGHGD